MKKLVVIFFIFILLVNNVALSRNWCKAIYSENISPGGLQEQINKCKNSDNFFLAIHTSYKNAGHLLNGFVGQYCDLNRGVIRSEPRKGDPYFSIVCEFRRHFLRK